MAWLYGAICVTIVWSAAAAGWDLSERRYGWASFWLLLSVACLLLAVLEYPVFVGSGS